MNEDPRRADQSPPPLKRPPALEARIVVPPRAVGYHAVVLVAAVVVLAGASILGTTSDGRVRDPWFGVRLPSFCALKRTTGLDCPGCGLTRCFTAMGHGQWRLAFHHHPVGTAIFVVVLAQIPYRAIQLWRLARGKNDFSHAALWAIPVLLVAAMVVQWLWRMLLLFRS